MPSAEIVALRVARAILLAIGLSAVSFLGAVEKYWVGREADAIVVDEVLFGGRLPRRISMRLLCDWEHHCQWWPARAV